MKFHEETWDYLKGTCRIQDAFNCFLHFWSENISFFFSLGCASFIHLMKCHNCETLQTLCAHLHVHGSVWKVRALIKIVLFERTLKKKKTSLMLVKSCHPLHSLIRKTTLLPLEDACKPEKVQKGNAGGDGALTSPHQLSITCVLTASAKALLNFTRRNNLHCVQRGPDIWQVSGHFIELMWPEYETRLNYMVLLLRCWDFSAKLKYETLVFIFCSNNEPVRVKLAVVRL